MHPIIIQRNKKVARKYFIEALNRPELAFVLKDLELPVELTSSREKVDISWKRFFSYSKYKLTRLAYKTFDAYYKRASNDIEIVYKWLVKNMLLWNIAYSTIPTITKIPWKKQVVINVVFGRWAATKENLIYIGIRPFSFLENPQNSVILHEMFHVNIEGQIPSYLSYPHKTEELIATLFTRQLIKYLRDKNGIIIPDHAPDISYGDFSTKIVDNIEEFDALARQAESIFDLARKIDKYFFQDN